MTTTDISPLKTGAAKTANAAGAAVTRALKEASEATGVGFDVLYNIAKRESSFNPDAKAKTSSAAGLFQFIEQTWLGAVKDFGGAHGLAAEAAAITRRPDGKLAVADPARRKEILDLRFDAGKAAALAGELAQTNAAALQQKLGRAVDRAEIYAAHFLGVGGAAKLLNAPSTALAADLLPAAAKANKPVFYEGGAKKTVGDVVASIAKSMNAAAPAAPQGAPDAPSIGELRWAELYPDTARSAYARSAFSALLDGPAPRSTELTPFSMTVLQALDPTRIAETERKRKDAIV